MSRDLEAAGAECVHEMSAALLQAASQTMARHGNDPDSLAIITAGFAMAIVMIGKHIDPRMPSAIREMLAEKPHA